MKGAAAASEPLWAGLRALMLEWTSIVLGPRDADSALHTLRELAKSRGLSPSEYLRLLADAGQGAERQRLIGRLAIGATWFMREAAGLQALVTALRTELGPGRPVRIWSAGCSTGQEPYCLAMALVEADLQPRILATDINQTSLRLAQEATYPLRALAALPPSWQARYVIRRGSEQGSIHPSITSLVSFAQHNLASSVPPAEGWDAFDAVVCRNVLMYFDRLRAPEVVRRLSRRCRTGGYVLLSAAERPLVWMTQALEEVEQHDDIVLLKRAATAHLSRHDASSPPMRVPAPVSTKGPVAGPARTSLGEATRLLEAGDLTRGLQILDGLLANDLLLAEAHLLRGLALKRRGALTEAAAALRCARFLFSDEAWLPPYHLGLVLEQLGELEEAFEAYRHARAVVGAGSRSGLSSADGAEEALALTIAEACAARLRVLQSRHAGER